MKKKPLMYVIISAALFGISTPLAKVLVADIQPVALAGLLYFGAFLGLLLLGMTKKMVPSTKVIVSTPLERRDLPWLGGAILAGGIIAPIALMTGLTMVSGFASSLLLNLEGVATAIIAVFIFKEYAGRRIWLALVIMTLAGVSLSWNTSRGELNLAGPILIVFAMTCWGIDNNLTKKISNKDPVQIALIKGMIAGTVLLLLAFILGIRIPLDSTMIYALILGSLSYGVSIVLFIKGLEGIGACRTGAFYSFGPFVGAIVSILVLGETVSWALLIATLLMVAGVWIMVTDKHGYLYKHTSIMHKHAHN